MFSHLIVAIAAVVSASTPTVTVTKGYAEVQKVLDAPKPTVEALSKKADEFVDFTELAKRALGAEWGKLTKPQQAEFSATMKGLLRASYAQKAISDKHSGMTIFEYGEEKVTGNEAVLNTAVVSKADKIPVVYKLYRPSAAGAWKVYDVVTDDVSLLGTYSDQFRQVIAKKSFKGLLASLKAKRDQLDKNSAAVTN